MMRHQLMIALVAAMGLTACAAQIQVSEIPNDLAPGSTVDGIPFRTPKRFIAVIYEKQNGGYQEVARKPVTLPDPNHLYVLGFRSQMFSNATIELMLNADNTIQQVSLKSVSAAAGAFSAAGTQLNAVATAEQTRQQKAAATATTSADLAIAADKAKQAADLGTLQHQLLVANPNASAEDLLKAAQKERSAKLDANEAARLARKQPYFPDVLP